MSSDPSINRLNSIKEHKLTRRRVLEAATAAGMSSAAALTLTPEDVKAADSDQVTVPFDVHGNSKFQIASDTLDWYYRARDATEHIRKRHQHKVGVATIGTRGGGKKDNAHVIVRLERKGGKADERRGEIPEEHNGIRVEVEEYDEISYELHCSADHWPEDEKFPGGQQISPTNKDGNGTNSSRFVKDDYSWFGWTTAAHVLQQCTIDQDIRHNVDLLLDYNIGTVTHIDERHDIAFIKNDYQSTSPYCIKADGHNEGVKILGTVSEEGFVTLDEQGGIAHYGVGNDDCSTDFQLKEWNESSNFSTCGFTLRDMMYLDSGFDDSTADGDSGSLYFVEDPNNPGNWYAMGSHTGSERRREDGYILRDFGPQGFTIYDIYDKAWRS